MKSKKLCITSMALFAALAVPLSLSARDHRGHNNSPKHHHYQLIDMGTFGGPASNAIPFLNNSCTMIGGSATAVAAPPITNFYGNGGFDGFVPFVFHTFQWTDGAVTDLGALPGSNENFSNPGSINATGEITGDSENGIIDPVSGFLEVRAVLWKDGQILDLGTLGGNHSVGNAINNRAQLVGFAL